jgi:hypothetical protein
MRFAGFFQKVTNIKPWFCLVYGLKYLAQVIHRKYKRATSETAKTSVSCEISRVQEAWEQGTLFCKVSFCLSGYVCFANVPNLMRRLSILPGDKTINL